jgi:hypothetical protein
MIKMKNNINDDDNNNNNNYTQKTKISKERSTHTTHNTLTHTQI